MRQRGQVLRALGHEGRGGARQLLVEVGERRAGRLREATGVAAAERALERARAQPARANPVDDPLVAAREESRLQAASERAASGPSFAWTCSHAPSEGGPPSASIAQAACSQTRALSSASGAARSARERA